MIDVLDLRAMSGSYRGSGSASYQNQGIPYPRAFAMREIDGLGQARSWNFAVRLQIVIRSTSSSVISSPVRS